MRLIDVYPYRSGTSNNEFLIFKRSPDKQYAGQWRMVGGKIETGETAWEAGLRELEEETNVKPIDFWTIPSLNNFYNSRNDEIEMIPAFAAKLPADDEITLNEEHTDYKWIESSNVHAFIPWPEQCRLITLVDSILTDHNILEDWKISF